MISRELNFNVDIDLTTKELALAFCNMTADDQVSFFNEVAVITSKWDAPFVFQLQFIIDDANLTPEGRRVMEKIGEYGQKEDHAPQLLTALEILVGRHTMTENYDVKIYATKEQIEKAKAAIAAAKGE